MCLLEGLRQPLLGGRKLLLSFVAIVFRLKVLAAGIISVRTLQETFQPYDLGFIAAHEVRHIAKDYGKPVFAMPPHCSPGT